MSMDSEIISTGFWRWLQGAGLERFELMRASDAWIFRGTILAQVAEGAFEARYELVCDKTFLTRRAQIHVRGPAGERTLAISAENGRWHANGSETASVRGALDIDLGWSPSTNTLPIRRIGLQVGRSSGEFTAAWVRFPGLTLEPLSQEYVRLSQRLYRYSSRGGAFTAQLHVDDQGLVVDYQGFWQRVRAEEHT